MVNNINDWIAKLITELRKAFDNNLLFVGLQGSYKRGEATEGSDIDAVIILDTLTLTELKTYREIFFLLCLKETRRADLSAESRSFSTGLIEIKKLCFKYSLLDNKDCLHIVYLAICTRAIYINIQN